MIKELLESKERRGKVIPGGEEQHVQKHGGTNSRVESREPRVQHGLSIG